MKRVIVTALAAGLVTLGSVGVAAAQTGGTTTPSTPAPSATHHGHARVGLLRVAARTLGVTPRDLLAGACGGQTIGQLAAQHGKSSQDLINALVKAADQRIDRAVTTRHLDGSKAAARKQRVEAQVTKLVNDFHPSSAQCQRLQNGGVTTPTSTS
jgi:hypothetical protein